MLPTETNSNARARKSQRECGDSLLISFRPLRAALAHTGQLKLLLRRARRDARAATKSGAGEPCLNRLLDTLAHISASIESLDDSQSQTELTPVIRAGVENLLPSGGLQ